MLFQPQNKRTGKNTISSFRAMIFVDTLKSRKNLKTYTRKWSGGLISMMTAEFRSQYMSDRFP